MSKFNVNSLLGARKSTLSQKNITGLVVAAALVILTVIAAFWSFRLIEESAGARKHTFTVINKAEDVMSALKDAETGQRGFLLTGDEAFLQPYLQVRDTISVDLANLRETTLIEASKKHLDTLIPLIATKMQFLGRNIELRQQHDLETALQEERGIKGKPLMDAIRAEIVGIAGIENDALAQYDADFQSSMRSLFVLILTASVLTLLFSISFVYLLYRQSQQRLEEGVLAETQHLLELQEDTSRRLIVANISLQNSEEGLAVTLNSIGDAVIATDDQARVTRLNPVAEQLTGWRVADAIGRPVGEVFNIINQETRLPVAIPIMDALAHGTVQGLANHTVLISRDGTECAIADSCAPIRDRAGQILGAILVFRNVTEEYAVQQALRDSAALVQTILYTVADGVITLRAQGGVVETSNPAAEAMFGYSAAELVGQNFSLLIPELDQDQRNGSLEYYSASAAEQAVGQMREVTGRRKDGRSFPLEMAVSEMWLGGQRYFTGILRDITARKQAEESLIKAGALQSAIFNSANFSSIATDAKGVIQIFNVGAERMLGYTAAEVMNKITPADISDPHELIVRAEALSIELEAPISPGFEALVFKARRGIEDIYELTYIRKDGSRFPAVVSVTALRDAEHSIIGYLLIGTDNTARKLIEEERSLLDQALQDKNIELESAKEVAEKANQAKSVFLSSMSHELRTPLSAILGFAQLIESGSPEPTATQKRSIDQILKAGWYLLELINEILDLALIESGKLSLSLEPISLFEVMHECQTMVEPQAQKRGIGVTFNRLDAPVFVVADRTRLKQVLINLLSNAIKYNQEAGTVVVECLLRSPETLRISVRDTGAGLSPENISQLFQPFNRLGKKGNVEEGTGIGLVVCKRLVELMRGVIGVESTVGEGSVFWIELCLTTEHQLDPHLSEIAHIDLLHEAGAKAVHTLLYVEDNPANLMLVEDIIARRPDIRLESARDGRQGIEKARALMPDVILMDINLPGISGIEALEILAADLTTAHIPVIALSANAIPRDIEKGLAAGFFRYLTKPIKVKEFMDTLDVALRVARKEAVRTPNEDLS